MKRLFASAAPLIAAAMILTSCSPGTGTGSPPGTVDSAPSAPANPPETPTPDPTTSAQESAAPTTASATPTEAPVAPTSQAAPHTSVAAAPETAAPAPAQGLAAEADKLYCQGGSHEGCHTYADMRTYLNHVLALIAPMFDELYGTQYRPANFYFIDQGLTGESPCLNQEGLPVFSSTDYAYCPTNQSIYTGQDQLWEFYSVIGDAAPAVGYAHEWGHHLQTIMGIPNDGTQKASITMENQADCVAGAWVYYAATQGLLEYPDDLGDIGGILQAIASSEDNPQRTHGTIKERTDSLNYGYNYGLRGCNGYFPTAPIFKG